MNYKKLRSRLAAASLAITLLLVPAFSSAQTVDTKPEVKKEILAKVSDLITTRAYVPGIDFSKWPAFLDGEKAKLDASKDDDEFARDVNEALQKFGASHVFFTTPRSAEIRRTSSTVGIGISSLTTDDGLLVVRTVPGAPADKAGLVPGDLIVEVDGKKVEGIKGIPGPEGTQVKLKVKHQNGQFQEFTLTRAAFSTKRPEELVEVNKDTAKLNVYTFDFTYSRENVDNLMKKAQKYKNLILDLRDNGGGAVVNLQHLLGLFIPNDDGVGTFVDRRMVSSFEEETGGSDKDLAAIAKWSPRKLRPFPALDAPVYKGKVVVLVNQFSGSASEICAEALRDEIGAQVVGSKSAGAVLVSVIVPASHGFMLQYPLADYITIKGQRLEGNGVTPDVEVSDAKYRLPNAPDPVLEKAETLFTKTN